MAQTPYRSLSPLEFVKRMDYGEKFILLVDFFDIVTDFIFFSSIDNDETLRYAVVIFACLGVLAWLAKLWWLKGAIEHDFDAWDTTHGLVNFGYVTLLVEDIPQIVLVILITASNDMPALALMQLAFTCVACVWKCAQDLFLALNCLAIDLTGQRKTTGEMLVEKHCPCCITDFDPDNASPYCAPFYQFCGILCISNYAQKQRAKNERDIEDGGNTLPSTPNMKNTFKNTDVALLTARPLLFNGSPLNLQTNARQVTDRLKHIFMKAIAPTERTFAFAHYTGSSNNFQLACVDNAQVIHYSGTALEGKLAFESDPRLATPGQMTLVDGDVLKKLMNENSCKLAFVASPAPRFAGQVFLDAGIEHVICIYSVELKDQTIESQVAANAFTTAFYTDLISGSSVSKAYNTAILNAKSYPGYNADNFMLLPRSGGASFHDVVIFDPSAETSREGFKDRSYTPQVKNVLYNDDGLVGKEQRVADIIPAMMKSSVNVLVGSDVNDNTNLMMATSNYLVERNCFNKGAHYLKFAPLQADPATYCLDLFLAREVLGKDTVPSNKANEMVLDWLRDQESNDHVGLMNCLLLCCDGLRPLLIDTQFDENSTFGFITEDVRKKNLHFLKELLLRNLGLKILVCSPNQDVLNLLLDSDVPKVNPKAIMVNKSIQPSESLHL